MSAYSSFAKQQKWTPQTQPIFGKEMVQNNAGGYVFAISPLDQFRRFLILGTSGGTYYSSEQKLTIENAKNIIDIFNDSNIGSKALDILLEISQGGLAPKVSPVVFALAVVFSYGTREVKQKASSIFNKVIRTHSHLFEFVSYVDSMRSWGRMLRTAVANWYTNKTSDNLGYQLAKYRNRNTWTTKDVLRMAHPKPQNKEQQAMFAWACGKEYNYLDLPKILNDSRYTFADEKMKNKANFVLDNNLTHEMIPNTWLNEPSVWEALLVSMPPTALIRNLAKMTSVGLLTSSSISTNVVIDKLKNIEYLKQGRIHPFSILLALTTYKQGHGYKGNLMWNPVTKIIDALDDVFYSCFKYIEPTNRSYLIAIDISGSMGTPVQNSSITAAQASLAMAMSIAKVEENYEVVGFNHQLVPFTISPRQRLDDIVVPNWTGGGTDCAKPMIWAQQQNKKFDTFIVFTDNETWYGNIHPAQALQSYRRQVNPEAKLVVSAMTATKFSIADPNDRGMLDIVGLDASLPTLISNFSLGKV